MLVLQTRKLRHNEDKYFAHGYISSKQWSCKRNPGLCDCKVCALKGSPLSLPSKRMRNKERGQGGAATWKESQPRRAVGKHTE